MPSSVWSISTYIEVVKSIQVSWFHTVEYGRKKKEVLKEVLKPCKIPSS